MSDARDVNFIAETYAHTSGVNLLGVTFFMVCFRQAIIRTGITIK